MPPVSLDAVTASPYGAHIVLRMQYVVGQVIDKYAGHPEAEVAKVLDQRFRALGLTPNLRYVHHLAEVIAQLPKATDVRARGG